MGFYLKAKHGLNSKFDLRPNLVSNWGREKCRERGEEEKREEEEEEEKKKRRGRRWRSKKVWKLTLIMDSMRFGMDLWFCMVIILPQT